MEQIKSYERRPREKHSGGRPKGCQGKSDRVKLTTTLHWRARQQLRELAETYGLGLGDTIGLLLHAQATGATFEEALHLCAPEGHTEDVAERNRMLQDLLSGGLELAEG